MFLSEKLEIEAEKEVKNRQVSPAGDKESKIEPYSQKNEPCCGRGEIKCQSVDL